MCFCCVFSWTKRNDTRTAFCVTSPAPPTILNEASSKHELLLAIAELTRSNAELVQKSQALELAHERLRAAYLQALERLELLRRRLFLAKKERLDSAQIQLELDGVQAQVEELERALAQTSNEDTPAPRNEDTPAPPLDPKAKSSKGHGRRNLADAELPETTVEILDPELEGKAERIGFEDHYELSYQRGGMRKVRVRRAKYKVNAVTSEGEPQAAEQEQRSHISVAPAPRVLQQRGFLAASMISHILVMKYAMGVPFLSPRNAIRAGRLRLGSWNDVSLQRTHRSFAWGHPGSSTCRRACPCFLSRYRRDRHQHLACSAGRQSLAAVQEGALFRHPRGP